jgi:hypothetical protein
MPRDFRDDALLPVLRALKFATPPSLSAHTKMVVQNGYADGFMGSVTDSEPAAAEAAGTASIGYGWFPLLCSANPWGSDADDGQEVFDPSEVIDFACVEREVGAHGGGGDQQIDGSGATCLAPPRDDRGVDASVGPCRVGIERQWIEAGLGSLRTAAPGRLTAANIP